MTARAKTSTRPPRSDGLLHRELYDIVCAEAKANCVDRHVAAAIVGIVSNWDPFFIEICTKNFHPFHPLKMSRENGIDVKTEQQMQAMRYGLMGLPGWVARELGYRGPLQKLHGPATNAEWGCKFLLKLRREMRDEPKIISAYFEAESYDMPKSGRIRNEAITERVLERLLELRSPR